MRNSISSLIRKLYCIRKWNRITPLLWAIYLSFQQGKAKIVRVPIKLLGRKVVLRLNESDLTCIEKVFLQREYDYPYPSVPRIIVDAGANVGMATLFFALKYPNARIIALEPEKSNFKLMEENCSGLPNVTLINAALWSERRQLQVVDSRAAKWAVSFVPATGACVDSVSSISMVDLLKDYHLDYIDLLKMDIEGAEKEVFSSDPRRWLTRVGIIVIELHDRFVPGAARSFYRAIQEHEFTQAILGEMVMVHLNPNVKPRSFLFDFDDERKLRGTVDPPVASKAT